MKLLIEVTGDDPLNYYIQDLEKFRILGLSIELTENMEENQKIVPLFWKKILNSDRFKELLSLNPKAKNIFGITEFKGPNEIYYHVGILSNKTKPACFNECLIPNSTWAIFENQGNFKSSVQGIFKRFYKEWLPFSGYKYGFLSDIEIYSLAEKFSQSGHSKVLISIEKEN